MSSTSTDGIVYTEEWDALVKNVFGGNAPLFMGDGEQLKAAAEGFAGAFVRPLLSKYSEVLDTTEGTYTAGDGGSQSLRTYKPRENRYPGVVVVFFHGGGEYNQPAVEEMIGGLAFS